MSNNPEIEYFLLTGVHGYKDIGIDFKGAATIIVAENGAGKTTVLSALNAFLTRRFHRLAALSFTSLECKFKGIPEPLRLSKSSVSTPVSDSATIIEDAARNARVSPDELLDFIQNQYSPGKIQSLKNHPLVHTLYTNTAGPIDEVERILEKIYRLLSTSLTEDAKEVSQSVRGLMSDAGVIYLPTYRRIEKPLLRPRKPRASFMHRSERNDEKIYEGMAFGLSDIEDRLTELSADIERYSNIGYRSLTTRILDEQLRGHSIPGSIYDGGLPDIKSLSLFLGRLGKSDSNLASVYENIAQLYSSSEITDPKYDFLRYFLTRLNPVINETRNLEQRIERFVNVCNSYLTMSSDEKRLSFDAKALKVIVWDDWAGKEIPLDALSSGEKQIISLMAKLHLYEGAKFVLIDEPELSLSIDWQKKVLLDIRDSGSVHQFLAITHSPFVFDNELDSATSSMFIRKNAV